MVIFLLSPGIHRRVGGTGALGLGKLILKVQSPSFLIYDLSSNIILSRDLLLYWEELREAIRGKQSDRLSHLTSVRRLRWFLSWRGFACSFLQVFIFNRSQILVQVSLSSKAYMNKSFLGEQNCSLGEQKCSLGNQKCSLDQM